MDGFLKLVRLAVLPAEYRTPAIKAWQAITEKYAQDGVVVGVSAGTNPGGLESYRTREVGSQTWGTRAYLLTASEIQRLHPRNR